MSLIIENMEKTYGPLTVLKDINIKIGEGEFLVLLGPSGCGKSTLLNLIAGLSDISRGSISIAGQLVNSIAPKDRNIAMVFQSYALYPSMTVRQNLSFGLETRGVPKQQREELILKAASLLQIEPLLSRKPYQLSGGQRQRVAIGRALVREPVMFLFDEPLSNLDAKLRIEMRGEIKRLHQRLRTTMVYVTHDQIEAMTLATKVAVMNHGIVQQFGTPREIYQSPANVFVASFIGSPPMNLVPAILIKMDEGWRIKISSPSHQEINLPLPAYLLPMQLLPAQPVLVGLRPEFFSDKPHDPRAHHHYAVIEIVPKLVEPTGADDLVTVSMGGVDVVIRMRPDVCQAGKTRQIHLNIVQMVLFDPTSGLNLRTTDKTEGRLI